MKKALLKKLLCGSLAVSLALSLMACGGTNKEDPKTTTDSTAAGSTIAAADDMSKQVELEWLTWQYAPVEDALSTSKKMLEEKFNVKFNIWYLDVSKRDEVLPPRIAAGQIPDFMTIYSDSDLLKWYEQGATQMIPQEEAEKYLPTWNTYLAGYSKDAWSYAKVKDKDGYMGIPNVNPDGIYCQPVVWNKLWLDKVGITKVPETLDEWKDALYKFVNNDPDGNGKKDTYGMSTSALMNVFGAFGVYPGHFAIGGAADPLFWNDVNGKLEPAVIQPGAKQALEVLRQWKKDGIIEPEWFVGNGENKGGYWAISQLFHNGKIGVTSQGMPYHWTPVLYEGAREGENAVAFREATGKNPADAFAFGTPPKGPEGKFGNILPGTKASTYMGIGKNADETKRLRIYKIWEAVYSDFDLWMQVKFGEKDKDYKIGTDGITVEQLDPLKGNNAEQGKRGLNITFAPFGRAEFTAKIVRSDAKAWTDKNFIHEGAGNENMLKAVLPSDPKYSKSLDLLAGKYFVEIINGSKDISAFDEFVSEFMKQGGEQLIKEANEWYTEYKASK